MEELIAELRRQADEALAQVDAARADGYAQAERDLRVKHNDESEAKAQQARGQAHRSLARELRGPHVLADIRTLLPDVPDGRAEQVAAVIADRFDLPN